MLYFAFTVTRDTLGFRGFIIPGNHHIAWLTLVAPQIEIDRFMACQCFPYGDEIFRCTTSIGSAHKSVHALRIFGASIHTFAAIDKMVAEIAVTFRVLDTFCGIFPVAIIHIFHVIVVVIDVVIDDARPIAATIGTFRGGDFPFTVDTLGNCVIVTALLTCLTNSTKTLVQTAVWTFGHRE